MGNVVFTVVEVGRGGRKGCLREMGFPLGTLTDAIALRVKLKASGLFTCGYCRSESEAEFLDPFHIRSNGSSLQ